MEKINTTADKEEPRLGGILSGLRQTLGGSISRGREGSLGPIYDAALFVIAFLFARCHLVFGAYPMALGVIAILPSRVWPAVLGAVVGALTLGKSGIIYAIISLIVAFLRVIISATDKRRQVCEGAGVFGESLPLRLSVALIGGFIAAVYEVLLNSLTEVTALFGGAMIILPPAIAFSLSGLFGAGISPTAFFVGCAELLTRGRLSPEERGAMLRFRTSLLVGVFLVSISLSEYEIFGISAGFVASALVSQFAARRFGAVAGAVAGFVSSVGLSGIYTPAFTLGGLLSGALYKIGTLPAVLLGGAVASLWGGYVGGLSGFLSVLPEYAIAAAVAVPLFKRLKPDLRREEIEVTEAAASDMVSTMALTYKSRHAGAVDAALSALTISSGVAERAMAEEREITREEYRRLVTECISRYFKSEGRGIPAEEDTLALFINKVDVILPILMANGRLVREDLGVPPHLSLIAGGICEAINRAVGIVTEEIYRDESRDTSADDLEFIARLISEARLCDSAERAKNERLTEAAENALSELGIVGGSALVLGERRPYFLIAIEDETGATLSSPSFLRAVEDATGVSLARPEFYRKGKMALMECRAAAKYSASSYSVGSAMSDECSGDTSRSVEASGGRYFSLITDGMGSGEEAARTARHARDFLLALLEAESGTETALRLANNLLRHSRRESTATVDLFSFDLVTGEATFHKCGAAPSYIRRGSSLFRIRSGTSPIGISRELDAERIKAELLPGDLVIMFSDGVSSDGEAPWLIDTLSRQHLTTPEALAEAILAAAKKHSSPEGAANGAQGAGGILDDLTVTVTEIRAAEKQSKNA